MFVFIFENFRVDYLWFWVFRWFKGRESDINGSFYWVEGFEFRSFWDYWRDVCVQFWFCVYWGDECWFSFVVFGWYVVIFWFVNLIDVFLFFWVLYHIYRIVFVFGIKFIWMHRWIRWIKLIVFVIDRGIELNVFRI